MPPCLQVKQLGSGDVGMVDLVQLVGSEQRFALKSLEKREMLERNKVGAGRLVAWRALCFCCWRVLFADHSLRPLLCLCLANRQPKL